MLVVVLEVTRSCILLGVLGSHVCCRCILNDVVKALEGSSPFYSFSRVHSFYVATGFVIVPLPDEFDEFTFLEATGHASMTKDGAEESAASALITAAKHDFGIVVNNPSMNAAELLAKENENLRRNNLLLKSGWVRSVDHLAVVQKTLEQITVDAIGGSSRTSIGILAHGVAVWAEENVWTATAAMEELSLDVMDEN